MYAIGGINMAYYFMVEKKKGQYESLGIDSLFDSQKRKYSKAGAFTLQELDAFTMQFDDEYELRKILFYKGVLPSEYIDKPLSIRWASKGEYTKVPYDFLYQKDMVLVLDPSKLVELIMKRYYSNDFFFIKKFAEHFNSYHDCSTTAPEVMMYADMAIKNHVGSKYLEERDRNNNNMVERLIKLLLFEYYEYPSGYIDYKIKIKYRNLHTMIAFINNYDVKYGIVKKNDNRNIRDIVPEFRPKTRKRVKRNEEVDGQISLFDMLDDES